MPLYGKSGRKRSESCNRSCVTAQKVVISKGMINPDETTVIEIPYRLHKQPVVVVKLKDTAVSSLSEEETRTFVYADADHPEIYVTALILLFTNMQQGGQCEFTSPNNAIQEISNNMLWIILLKNFVHHHILFQTILSLLIKL